MEVNVASGVDLGVQQAPPQLLATGAEVGTSGTGTMLGACWEGAVAPKSVGVRTFGQGSMQNEAGVHTWGEVPVLALETINKHL